MPIKDLFLPLVGQPREPTLAAIETCVALAADLGARITALALEEDVFVRPKVVLPDDQGAAEARGSREPGDVQQLLTAFTRAASRANIRAQGRSAKVPADQIASPSTRVSAISRWSPSSRMTAEPSTSSKRSCSNPAGPCCSARNNMSTSCVPNSRTS